MKRFLPVFWFAWVMVLGRTESRGAGLETPADFTRGFVEAMRVARPEVKAEVAKDLELKLTNPDGHSVDVYLNNAYDNYRQAPENRDKVLKTYVATSLESLATTGKDVALDPTRIVPIIKDRAWMDEVRKSVAEKGAKKPLEMVAEDLNEDLVILYAEDNPQSIHFLTPERLKAAKIEKADLRKLAAANLEKLLPPIERKGGKGVYMITAGGTYEASLLAVDSFWTDGKLDVDGDIVVAVPARDLLIVTGSKDKTNLEKMRRVADNVSQKGSYRLTPKLFVYRKGKFEEFKGE